MNWLNVVQGKLNEIWVVKLSDGGKVHLKFDLIQQDTIIEVEIVKVVDANNNTVNLNTSEWGGQVLQGSIGSLYFESIQHYLWRLGYTFSPLPNGRVEIKECRVPSDPPSNLPSCY